MPLDPVPETGVIDRSIAARTVVVTFSAVVVEVDVAEIPSRKELIEVPVEVGMPAVERPAEATAGKFGQEGRGAEMAALPCAHVLHADHDPVFFLQTGEVIERVQEGRIGAVADLLVRRIPGVDHEVFCADAVADREHVTQLIHGCSPRPFPDRCNVHFTRRCMDRIRERVLHARPAIDTDIVQTVREDLHARCPGRKGFQGGLERAVDAAERRDVEWVFHRLGLLRGPEAPGGADSSPRTPSKVPVHRAPASHSSPITADAAPRVKS